MSYRDRPPDIKRRVEEIEERLRRTTTDVVGMVVITDHGGLAGLGDDDHGQYQLRSEKDQPNGYAGLDAGGLIDLAQLPADPAQSDLELLMWLGGPT